MAKRKKAATKTRTRRENSDADWQRMMAGYHYALRRMVTQGLASVAMPEAGPFALRLTTKRGVIFDITPELRGSVPFLQITVTQT